MSRNTKGIEVAGIISDRCIGCQICVNECPVGAIEISDEGTAVMDPEVCIGCGKCHEVYPVGAVRFERKKRQKTAVEFRETVKDDTDGYHGVAVFIEQSSDQGADVSWELVTKSRELASRLNCKVIGLVLGYNVLNMAKEAIAYGCDEVHTIDHPLLRNHFPSIYGAALADLSKKVKPEILLIGATLLGRDLSGTAATLLQTGLTADCTVLDIDEQNGYLLMTRPTFCGNILATIDCRKHRPQMSTVRPRVMSIGEKISDRQAEIISHPWNPSMDQTPEIVDIIKEHSQAGVDIVHAPALVVAGKGACDPASVPMLQELAGLIGGVMACSRPVVESGLMPYERQVGQTGKTVAPKLYIGVGVSGAIQHLAGIQGSEKIVAINSDPQALIFQVADVGLVGDYLEVVPALIAGLKKRVASHAGNI